MAAEVLSGDFVAVGDGVLVGFAVAAAAGVFSGAEVGAADADGVWVGFVVPHQFGISHVFSSAGRMVNDVLIHQLNTPFPVITA